jgi:hypothetical protein
MQIALRIDCCSLLNGEDNISLSSHTNSNAVKNRRSVALGSTTPACAMERKVCVERHGALHCTAVFSSIHRYFFCQLEQLEAADSTAAPGFGGSSVASSPVPPFLLTTSRYFSVTTAIVSLP